jgi:hypothetical protein
MGLVVNYGRSTLRNRNSGGFRGTTPKHRNSKGLGFENQRKISLEIGKSISPNYKFNPSAYKRLEVHSALQSEPNALAFQAPILSCIVKFIFEGP